MRRHLLRALETFFLWLEDAAAAGLIWIERRQPPTDIDALIIEIERAHKRQLLDVDYVNVVHLPRRHIHTRRVH